MTIEEFRQSFTATEPPPKLTLALVALWWDAKGDWTEAHESAQKDEGRIVRGFTLTCIERKAIWVMRLIGTVALASPFVESRLIRSGSALRGLCWNRLTA